MLVELALIYESKTPHSPLLRQLLLDHLYLLFHLFLMLLNQFLCLHCPVAKCCLFVCLGVFDVLV
jgi:hypothetical protein